AAFGQLVHLLDIAGDQPAPERKVHDGGRPGGDALEVEAGGVDGGGMGVEWHLDTGGRATGGEGARSRGETLPLGTPWLVEVEVCVYHAGEDEELVAVDLLAGGALQVWRDGGDAPICDANIRQWPLYCHGELARHDG